MRSNMFWLMRPVIGLLLVAMPVLAHHSFMVAFDMSKPITLDGVVTTVDWSNPHISFSVDVKDDSGNVTNWTFDGAAPAALMNRGWIRTSMKPGDFIVVEAYTARNGKPLGAATMVLLADGRYIAAGSDGAYRK